MLWLLISASLSLNQTYLAEVSCLEAERRLQEAGHDAICIPIDRDAELAIVEDTLESFVNIVKGLNNETRR
jgi:hypothetical protein